MNDLPATDPLTTQVDGLLAAVIADSATPSPLHDRAQRLRARLDEPVRIGIAGRTNAGKSTLANALLGERLAPTDALECTRVPLWFRHGRAPSVLVSREGIATPARFERHGALTIDLGDPNDIERIDHVDVAWPTPALRDITLVDTPGLSAASGLGERHRADVDAVIYLMRHVHADDARFLEAFREGGTTPGTPASAIGVLSRADEVGGAGMDALDLAGRVARRMAAEPSLRRICADVIPVAGLLAEASVTLDETTMQGLRAVSADPTTSTLTATAFVESGSATPYSTRVELIDRFGIFGIRWCLAQVRATPGLTTSDLSSRLGEVSGLHDLQRVIERQFATSGRALVASGVLRDLEEALAAHPTGGSGAGWQRQCEQIRAGSVELDRLAVLSDARSGAVQVIGAGVDVAELVAALAEPASYDDLPRLVDTVDRWRRYAEHPLTPRAGRTAAEVLLRVLEHRAAAL